MAFLMESSDSNALRGRAPAFRPQWNFFLSHFYSKQRLLQHVGSMMGMGTVHSATLGHLRPRGRESIQSRGGSLSTLTEELSQLPRKPPQQSSCCFSWHLLPTPSLLHISACSISFSIPLIVFHCKENEIRALPYGFCDPYHFLPLLIMLVSLVFLFF